MPWDRILVLRLEDFWVRLFDNEKQFILSKINGLKSKPKDFQEFNIVIRKTYDEFCITQDKENDDTQILTPENCREFLNDFITKNFKSWNTDI